MCAFLTQTKMSARYEGVDRRTVEANATGSLLLHGIGGIGQGNAVFNAPITGPTVFPAHMIVFPAQLLRAFLRIGGAA